MQSQDWGYGHPVPSQLDWTGAELGSGPDTPVQFPKAEGAGDALSLTSGSVSPIFESLSPGPGSPSCMPTFLRS